MTQRERGWHANMNLFRHLRKIVYYEFQIIVKELFSYLFILCLYYLIIYLFTICIKNQLKNYLMKLQI